MTDAPRREVFVGDALEWLRARGTLEGTSVLTSLPDASELPDRDRGAWARFFVEAAELCARAADPRGLALFYQRDLKAEGQWFDKAALVREGALRAGLRCVLHWIVLRAPAGARTQGLAGYSHLVGFSREATLELRVPFADVLPDARPTTWTRGMGTRACRAACEAVLALTPTRTVLDPFCGHGTVLAVANAMGLHALGVELGHKRARKARSLTLASLEVPTPAQEE